MTKDNGTTPGSTVLEPEVLSAHEEVLTLAKQGKSNVDLVLGKLKAIAEKYSAEAQADLQLAQGCQVTDNASYEKAGQLLVALAAKRKGGEGIRELVCAPLYALWKGFRDLLTQPIDLRTQAEKVITERRKAYSDEQERLAEVARREAEQRAREEQARLEALARQRANRAAAKGDTEKAQEIRATVPTVTPAPVAVAPPPKTSGLGSVTYWHAAIVGCNHAPYVKVVKAGGPAAARARSSFLELVTAVAAGEIPLDALLPNESWLNSLASSLMKEMKYPGVEVWDEKKERTTGR